MKSIIAIRHVAFEDLGYFETVLEKSGFVVTYIEAGRDDLRMVRHTDPDLLVILGGPISVNQEHLYPFLKEELIIVEERLEKGRPTLGICLGAQIIAKALGARIYPAQAKEIGWSALQLTTAGRQTALQHLKKTPVFHWHGETFDLPPGSKLLASTEICENQAFSYDNSILALQFHPEVAADNLERWYIGHICELSGINENLILELRAEAAQCSPSLQRQGELFLTQWTDELSYWPTVGQQCHFPASL